MKRAALRTGILLALLAGFLAATVQQAENKTYDPPLRVADGVWFQQMHDIGTYGSNVGWIEFADFVVVVDTAFPLGAEIAIRNIKETTKGKPIRYAIVTHYHADHSFGTGVFAAEGATIIAHENARREYLARNLAQWESRAKMDPTAAKYKAYAPDLTFTNSMVLDDGKGRRAEIRFFGHAHTTGCIFTWLPREKILFTGDACVNGPFNYMGDSDTASWIDVLSRAQSLAPEKVVPGHGALGGPEVLEKQKRYFLELRARVAPLVQAGKSLEETQRQADVPMWREWTGQPQMKPDNIAHVYRELTRGPLNWHGDPGVTGPAVVAVPSEKGAPRPKLKYLSLPLAPDLKAAFAQVAPNVEILEARPGPEAMKLAAQVHGASGGFVTPEFLREAKSLRWVQQQSAGVENVVFIPELRGNDQIVLTNYKTMYGPNIADHVFAILLSFTRGIPYYEDLRRQQVWGRGASEPPALVELKGKTMLVVGLGGIGLEVARRAHAFDMRVLAVDPKEMAAPLSVSRLEKPDRLMALLPEADVVTIASPLTPETTRMFGSAQFSLMKPGAYFINIARGKEVDTQALLDVLQSGRLAGAGLDVTDPEPLPADHPLWKAPNLLLTPHVATLSPGSRARTRALWIENMRRFAAGEPMLNVVDKKAGY